MPQSILLDYYLLQKKTIIDNKKNRDTIKHRKGKNTSEDEKKGSDDE